MNFAVRFYLLRRLNFLQRKLERGDDLLLCWHLMNFIRGTFYRSGYCLTFDSIKHKWRISK